MRTRKILATAAAAAISTITALAAPTATALPSPQNPQSFLNCANKQVVFVPGGANTVPGVPEKLPHGSITAQMGLKLGLQPDTNLTYVGYQAFPFAVSTYQDSSNDGYQRTAAAIHRIQNNCPNSKINLVGYSEGADVAARILNDSAHNRGPLRKDKLASAVLYANPYQGGNGAAQWPTDMSGATGALGHLDGGFGDLAPNVLEVCHSGDAICNYPEKYRGLVSPYMKMDLLHGQLPLVQLVKEAVHYQPQDYINITKGLMNHVQYGGVDAQVGADWINKH